MKPLLTTLLLTSLMFGQKLPDNLPQLKAAAAKSVQSKESKNDPTTLTEWIAARNAEKEKCDMDVVLGESGTNGYDYWSARCTDSVMVYSDVTQETQERQAKENRHKAELADALVSRCLTAKEFKEVTSYRSTLYTREMEPYFQADVDAHFNSALLTQQILQQHCPIAERP